MRAWGIAVSSALALAGCGGSAGGGEDFAVTVRRPPAAVYAPLMAADVSEAGILFPGIRFDRSQPRDGEMLFTVPGTGSFPATIRLKLEAKDGGAATVIHAFVDVPKVRAVIDGTTKEISERKIERDLEEILKSTGRSLEMGSRAKAESERLSSLLLAVAIATDKRHLARAMALRNDPSGLTGLLTAFDPGAKRAGEQPEPEVDGREIRTVDPEVTQERREFAQMHAEWKQQEALEEAAAPTTDLGGGDYDYGN